MFLSDYYCPDWYSEKWVFDFRHVGKHQGMINQIGRAMFYLGDRYPHNVIFNIYVNKNGKDI